MQKRIKEAKTQFKLKENNFCLPKINFDKNNVKYVRNTILKISKYLRMLSVDFILNEAILASVFLYELIIFCIARFKAKQFSA